MESEAYLTGNGIGDVSPEQAGALVLPDAQPFADNRYKVTLARNLVTRSLAQGAPAIAYHLSPKDTFVQPRRSPKSGSPCAGAV